MSAKASAAYIERILVREDAWNETDSQLRSLAGRLYLQLPTFATIRVALGGNISSICVNDAIYDMTFCSTSSTEESAAKEKVGK